MIGNNLIQAAIVAKLKADTALTSYLSGLGAGDEIRESQWQGAEFSYPAVRIELGSQIPQTTGKCRPKHQEITFTAFCFSESDSSQQADSLAALVEAALFDSRMSGSGWRSLLIDSDGIQSAIREAARIWRASVIFRVRIYETSA